MNRTELEKKLSDILRNIDDAELVSVWNEYCYNNNYYDNELLSMDRFDEIYADTDPLEIATRCFYGHDEYNDESAFNPNRDYFYFNGYANPVSIDYVGFNEYKGDYMFSAFDESAVIDYIIENGDALYNDDIQELIDEYNDEL